MGSCDFVAMPPCHYLVTVLYICKTVINVLVYGQTDRSKTLLTSVSDN